MNQDTKKVILKPLYMDNFECIGTSCEDSCCKSWRISIDKKTYLEYRKVKDQELFLNLKKNITRNRTNASDNNYAKVHLTSNNRCPMLNQDSLCDIQQKLGEELLSMTCSTYPRIINQSNNKHEMSGVLSCPEIARLALLNQDKMEFTLYKDELRPKTLLNNRLNSNNKGPEKYFEELRAFTIQVLQYRSYSLSDRLIVLGMFFNKLQEVILENSDSGIPQLIDYYTKIIESDIRETLSNLEAIPTLQMLMLNEVSKERLKFSITGERYKECYDQFLKGILPDGDDTIEKTSERYTEAFSKYYLPFMEKHEYILENYLVNYVFRTLFPFGSLKSVFDEYAMLILRFSLIKMHLIGISGYTKEINFDIVIKLIQSFEKEIEHNDSFVKHIYKALCNNDYATLPYMIILIQN